MRINKKITVFLLAATASTMFSAQAVAAESITFMDTIPSPERAELLNGLLDRFMEENPDIQVEYTSVNYDDSYTKLVAMNASKQLPDVMTLDIAAMSMLAASNGLQELDEYWDGVPYKEDMGAAFITARPTYTYNDKMFVVPDGFLTRSIFVRTDWLEEIGYTPEELSDWTWDEYFEIVKKMTDEEKKRYGLDFRGGSNGAQMFFEYAMSELEQGTVFTDGTCDAILADERSVELFKNFYDLYKEGYAPQESINWGYTEMVQGFLNGQCGLLTQTPEVIATCESSMEEGTWTVLPYPKASSAEKNYVHWGSTAGYGVSSYSENKDAAWKLVEFLSSPEINLEYCKSYGSIPLYNSTLQDEFFQNGVWKGYADTLSNENVQYIAQPTELNQWGYFLSEYSKNEIQKYLLDEQDAETTVENMRTWLNEEYVSQMNK